jgi:cation:H+ antiporter
MNIIFIFLLFIVSAVVTWIAGVTLTKTTDSLDARFRIGDALGGLILLGIAGSLPELAIVVTAAIRGDIPVIIGNLIGGIAIQTLVLVIFDFAVKGKRPLSYLAGSITLFFETIFTIVLVAFTILGSFIPKTKSILHLNPCSILILIAWLVGLFLINKARENPRFNKVAPDASPGRKHKERRNAENHPAYAKKSTMYVILIFVFAAIITLVAGVLLEETGTTIAAKFGINSGIFAATILALVTALPEISTGLESIFIGDNQLAISDILGGNAFMTVIFFMADLIAKKPILSFAGKQDILFGSLGIVLMAVYGFAFLIRLKKRYFRLGLDSIFVILLYIAGIILLVHI